ncbi:RNA polymerase sigma factor RpoH [Magnetovibrio blakemorei]|uniref:RNA polymerase sigma factor n=1 Tax=Magnetovibrio blakemorei TaxID=28181 RepID=A0A1E5Q5T0_9PROT|nr:RNA polymerase sigma factor RpoH [Magnetovibrio blakemorei]OEJ65977.1 RNA polymerase factor sigma-32 [Magnetovibrio blakemorei]
MTALNLPTAVTESGLARYFKEAWKYPVLGAKEERLLAEKWRDEGDVDAAHTLVTSHLRLVVKIAMGYRGYGLPVADLVSEGNIGLMKAVKKFEPERGFRLSTYAMWWIKAAITEYVLRTWSMVKMGTVAAQKKLFFSLRRHKQRLGIQDSGELNPDQANLLSEQLDVKADEIISMNRRLATKDLSLNAPVGQDEGSTVEFQDQLQYEGASPEESLADGEERGLRHDMLRSVLDMLDVRERHIFMERRLKDDPVTLEELGQHYGISRERVRQLEARAFDKVQKAMTGEMADREQAAEEAVAADAPFLS